VILDALLSRSIRRGSLTVQYPDGRIARYGAGGEPALGVRIDDWASVRKIAMSPSVGFGECYMDGTLNPVGCTLYDLLEHMLVSSNENPGLGTLVRAAKRYRRAVRRIVQYNPVPRARRNVAHHYDLDGRLYDLFLDADRQYSCAYFRTGDETLEEAQEAKKRHIAAKLRLDRPGLEVLDIGSGWGGLALSLAREHGARVTGITLSVEQLHASRARAEAEGLAPLVRFELADYRSLDRRFDRIVSVGMFEHVGVTHYDHFFATIRRCLRDDGIALLHAIGRADGPAATGRWLEKYIFPGGYSPALSETFAAIERSKLWVTDCEILRLHYARTIAHWRARFAVNRDRIRALYDERFCRMFELYLAGCEITFRRQGHMNFQIQLSRSVDAVPLTRDYMLAAERASAAAGGREVVDQSGPLIAYDADAEALENAWPVNEEFGAQAFTTLKHRETLDP
jgi:cyclopropane-fatty-acyl-phospholipid synthase